MAEFLKGTKLVSEIETLIEKADEYLWLISPYINLYDRIKDILKLKKTSLTLSIIIIFGKNEEDKTLCREDFNFLKEFPNIIIGYEQRLHARYYASEDFSIITSMNLHQFSHNNNIEAGIKFKSREWLSLSGDGVDTGAFDYFNDVVDNATIIFQKEPVFKSGLLGLTLNYSHSEIVIDESENFYAEKQFTERKVFQHKVQRKK